LRFGTHETLQTPAMAARLARVALGTTHPAVLFSGSGIFSSS
jgi:hypothetical protein